MRRNRSVFFTLIYALIIFLMMFVHFYVQKNYGSDPGTPYRKRFFDKFLLQREYTVTACVVSAGVFETSPVFPVPLDRTI